MKTTDHIASVCPHCGYKMNASTTADIDCDAKPEPGDVSLCAECGAINQFDDNLRVIAMPREKQKEVLDSEIGDTIRRAQLFIAGKAFLT
jgi:DNA-directed RNA polymerase subunit RPC12/RpoP